MKTKQTKDSLPMWSILVLLLIVALAIYFFFKNERVKRYKNDLAIRIKEKESTINFLNVELFRLKTMHDTLRNKAIRFFKAIKIIALILLLSIGFICYAIFNMEYWTALFLIASIVTFAYYSITIIVQNKLGDFNKTLAIIQDYIIQQKFIKADFNPCMIEIVEKQLQLEKAELLEIKKQYLLE